MIHDKDQANKSYSNFFYKHLHSQYFTSMVVLELLNKEMKHDEITITKDWFELNKRKQLF